MPFPFGQFGKFWFVRHMSEESAAKDAAGCDAGQDAPRTLGVIAKCPRCGRCIQTYADETRLLCIDGNQHQLSGSPTAAPRVSDSAVCE